MFLVIVPITNRLLLVNSKSPLRRLTELRFLNTAEHHLRNTLVSIFFNSKVDTRIYPENSSNYREDAGCHGVERCVSEAQSLDNE